MKKQNYAKKVRALCLDQAQQLDHTRATNGFDYERHQIIVKDESNLKIGKVKVLSDDALGQLRGMYFRMQQSLLIQEFLQPNCSPPQHH